jgi:hypothetical protein
MKLLTKALLRLIPPLYASGQDADPLVVCKFFMPDAHWTWYVIEGATRETGSWGSNEGDHRPLSEFDPARDDVLFWGYVIGDVPEFGYFTLAELKRVHGVLGLPVERDRSFTPCRLSELKRRLKAA